ncbi:MAG: TIGR02302 family protein [Hyphomicrobiaceae bacterium]
MSTDLGREWREPGAPQHGRVLQSFAAVVDMIGKLENRAGRMAKSSERLSQTDRQFGRKIAGSRWMLYIERIWPRVWATVAVVAAFLLVSLFGIWPVLGEVAHWSMLAAFAIAFAVASAFVFSTSFPTREEALRRLEAKSSVPHRPASTYDDALSSAPSDGVTAEIWQAHRERMRRQLDRLHVSTPAPRTDRYDTFGLRAVMIVAVIVCAGLVGDAAIDRLQAAFRMGSIAKVEGLRLDAWVTPPPYTGRPPILVADGSAAAISVDEAGGGRGDVFEIPENSVIVVRMGGKPDVALELNYLGADDQPMGASIEEDDEDGNAAKSNQVRGIIARGTTGVSVTANGAQLARWSFNVVADQPPKIKFTKDFEKTPRGAMKLFYAIEDDYGIASAEAKFERLPLEPGDPKTKWARPDILKGPRPPLERPPRIVLRVPPPGAKSPETWSFHELGAHPWAGMPVRMTLEVRDHADHLGRSESKDIVLPERLFFNPMARAVLEQRRRLVFDPRYRKLVVKALDALSLEPEEYIKDKAVYLGFRSVRHRLENNSGRVAISSAVEQLWHLALRIENGGGLSEAERRLREIQQKLSEAIERGASQQELQELMRQLRQALAQFLNELARQAQQERPPANAQQNRSPGQSMSSQDLQRMLDNLEQMMRQGSKQSAQEMLSQLRDLLDRLQSGRMVRRPGQGQQGRSQQMMQMMDQFGNLIGEQQRLMDDTFGAQRQGPRSGQRGQQGQRGQEGQRGQQGQRGQGQRGQGQRGQGQRGRGQRGQGQQFGRNGRGGRNGQQLSPDALGQRQGDLSRQLDRLRQGMGRFGLQSPREFDGAQQSMDSAEQALREGDLGRATEQQAQALEQLRSGTRSMAEQMLQQMPSRFGQSADSPLDPLGRPQRSEGPDLGTSVKVPDEIDAQRVREIIELLRQRLGERFRPELELDYIERLLRRF